MALTKVVYENGVTVITAENLNDIQDAIIAMEQGGASGDYDTLTNKPSIEGVTLSGSMALSSFGAMKAPASASEDDVMTFRSGSWVAAAPEAFPSAYTSTPASLGSSAFAGSASEWAMGDHVHPMPSAFDVGGIAAPSSASIGDFLCFTSNGWDAVSLPTYSGGSY